MRQDLNNQKKLYETGWSHVELIQTSLNGMRLFNFRHDNTMTVFGGREIISNWDKFVRPYESVHFSANYNFSHGHFLKNAGY